MLDVKQAVQIAREKSAGILGVDGSLEEIQRETYQGRDVWSITLGVLRNLEQLSPMSRLSANPVQYKVFLIDAETGEMLAMKLHALAPR